MEDQVIIHSSNANTTSNGFFSNPYFSAGAGLLGIGTGLALLRQILTKYGAILQRQFVISMDVTSRDKIYPYLLQWIASVPHWRRHHVSILSSVSMLSPTVSNSNLSPYHMTPGPGIHYFSHMRRWYKMERNREKGSGAEMFSHVSGMGTTLLNASPGLETITLTTFGRNISIFSDILDECVSIARRAQQGKTILYTSWANEWRPFGSPHRKRAFSSVILDGDTSQDLLRDISIFLSSASWYEQRGIPYRRGYLLYGPPGTGKSSFVKAIAGHLDYNICMMNLGEGIMTDDRLMHLLTAIPDRSIILLEDIDAAISTVYRRSFTQSDRAPIDTAHQSRVTLSGLLNALDGIGSSEDRILFATTNQYESLDPALLRPGRIDVQKYLGYATPYQAKKLFLQFYPTETVLSEKFGSLLVDNPQCKISPAKIQGCFIIHRDNPIAAIEEMKVYASEESKI